MGYSRYIEIQKKLAKEVCIQPLKKEINTVAGVDVSMNWHSNTLYAGIVVLSYPKLEILEEATVKTETDFPYIPGLLSFRELPAVLQCVKKLSINPDVYIVDGQGIAHPRKLGIAAHLGLELGKPSIGCAKSVLYGVREGERLLDPQTCAVLGQFVATKRNTNPLVISPGHLITLDESVEVVRKCLKGYKLPEPTRQAHLLVNRIRKSNQ